MVMLIIFVSITVGMVLGYFLRKEISRKRLESSKNLSARIVDEAKKKQKL
jgi:Domain of unknown function (DUF3552).